MRQSVDADNESRAETSPCAIYLAFFLFFLRNNCKKHFFFRPSIVSLVANQITSRRVIFSEHFSGEEKLDDLVLHAHDFLSNIFSMPYMRKYSSNSWQQQHGHGTKSAPPSIFISVRSICYSNHQLAQEKFTKNASNCFEMNLNSLSTKV